MPGSKVGNNARVKGPTTSRIHRHEPVYEKDDCFTPTAITPALPPAPEQPPRPLGDLTAAPATELVDRCSGLFSAHPGSKKSRQPMKRLLGLLETFPGTTWQERWQAAGLQEVGARTIELFGRNQQDAYALNGATGKLFAMRVIRPDLRVFRSYTFPRYRHWFTLVHSDDPVLQGFISEVDALRRSQANKAETVFDICCALTVFGIDLADLTPEALMHYAVECRKYGLTPNERVSDGVFAGGKAWAVLHRMGLFAASAPPTLRAAIIKGQRSSAELIDRYPLRNKQVRELLIDYIACRRVEVDYSTTTRLASILGQLFWKTIEEINPDQADLRLSEETITEWKKRLLTKNDGTPRMDVDGPLLAVRGLYLDLQSWAVTEPQRWAQWAAPCPIRDEDVRWFHVRRRRLQERMADRTRTRQPLLPVLSEYVNDQWQQQRRLMHAARSTDLGGFFTVDGTTYQRTSSRNDRSYSDLEHVPVRVINRDTGELVHLTRAEHLAFWQWAIIETLRLAGLRVEELTELTHLSVRNYRRSNGEVIALLVVSPSKTDRERVIPMSAELFHVIAQVIKRHSAEHGTVPIATRYDQQERTWSQPLPYLFQNVYNSSQRAMASHTVWRMIRRATAELAKSRPEFQGVNVTPHDFRRAWATEMVNNGLPIHIGAALLGHVNIQTTRGYVAVFDEDVIAHYQQFLDRRRALRPKDEYRHPTRDEWSEFQGHFDKRRVELGSCGRPYGTDCAHEHACIRCPMLSIDPKMLPRLDELEEDLLNRRQRAVQEDWLGEIEGLDLTLNFLRTKRTQAQRFAGPASPGTADLGMPTMPPQH